MNLWIAIEELRGVLNLDVLTASDRDRELLLYLRTAQGYAERYCTRQFDGTITRNKYFDLETATKRLNLVNTPIVSVAGVYNDPTKTFGSDTLVSASDYFVLTEQGFIDLKDQSFFSIQPTAWNRGQTSIKVVYKGGYIPEKSVVAAAAATNTMTIASNISGQPHTVSVQTSGTTVAGDVTIVGLDENGDAQTEVISFGTTAQRITSSYSWTSITSFSALPIANSGATVKLTATSFPEDLRAAILMHASHLYYQDQDKTINIGSRQLSQKSEAGYLKEVPKEVIQLLNGYKRYV